MNNDMKIIITGIDIDRIRTIADEIVKHDDTLAIAPVFTTNADDTQWRYFIDTNTANLSYKNNSVFFIYTAKYISTGILLEDYYKSNIFITNIDEFNNISDMFFKNDNTLIIWVDNTMNTSDSVSGQYKYKLKYLNERISANKYMYFINESVQDIASTIIKYIYADDDEKTLLLSENN